MQTEHHTRGNHMKNNKIPFRDVLISIVSGLCGYCISRLMCQLFGVHLCVLILVILVIIIGVYALVALLFDR